MDLFTLAILKGATYFVVYGDDLKQLILDVLLFVAALITVSIMAFLFCMIMFATPANAACDSAGCGSAELPITVTIINLNEWPVPEAIAECAANGWVCQGPCDNGSPEDIVWGCTVHNTCCAQANPYMGMAFDEPLPSSQNNGELSSEVVDGFTVYE
jgi:hypothetical protein